MESTNGQRCVNRRVPGQSVGADTVVGHNGIPLSPLEAHNTKQKQINLCNTGDEVNSHPAMRRAVKSSDNMTKFELLEDRVSVSQCTASAVSIL